MAKFIPELWSQKMLDTMKENLVMGSLPTRSHGAQLLRDVALGKPEYGPEIGDPPSAMSQTNISDRDTVELGAFTITVPGV